MTERPTHYAAEGTMSVLEATDPNAVAEWLKAGDLHSQQGARQELDEPRLRLALLERVETYRSTAGRQVARAAASRMHVRSTYLIVWPR